MIKFLKQRFIKPNLKQAFALAIVASVLVAIVVAGNIMAMVEAAVIGLSVTWVIWQVVGYFMSEPAE